MFCGSLSWKIKQIFQIGKKKEESAEPRDPDSVANIEDKSKRLQLIKIGKNDCCFTFINSTSTMELEGVWETPYSTNTEIGSSHKQQSVDDGYIEIVSYRNEISLCF
jgi:hypothetical protein